MRFFLIAVLLVVAVPALAYDWDYLSMSGVWSTCIVNDPVHQRVFVGTVEGFHYLEEASGVWTNRDDEGWIGREVGAIDWHPDLDQRVISGRVNAWFKGYLELSDDLGATGDVVYNADGGGVTDMLHDDLYHYACTWSDISPGEFVRSADSGQTWTLLTGHGHYVMTSMAFGLMGELFLAGDNGVMRSSDHGAAWDSASGDLPPGYGVYCIASRQPGGDAWPETFLYASNDLGLYRTYDGVTWEQVLPYACRAIATFPQEPSIMAVVTFDERVLVSSQFSEDFVDETGDLPGIPIDLTFSPWNNSLYVVTANSGVYRYEDVVTGVEPIPDQSQHLTLRASPNPFNPQTRFDFCVSSPQHARLEVFDTAGRTVATLLDAWTEAGDYAISWSPSGLASGVYFARLVVGLENQAIRVVLLK